MKRSRPSVPLTFHAIVLAALAGAAQAAPVQVTVTIENLAPANSISFAPLHLGFNQGLFDAFDAGQPAAPGIVSVAEGGSGTIWQADFAASEPQAVRGVIGMPLLPGQSRSAAFVVDPSVNSYFTFGSMVIPSNDYFIGNDSPTAYRVFDANGRQQLTSINLTASDLWNAGSEQFSIAGAAFLVNGNNDLRTPEQGVVRLSFAPLSGFNGETTAAGYVFDSQLSASTPIYRIGLAVTAVPEPQAYVLMAVGLMTLAGLSRWRTVKG